MPVQPLCVLDLLDQGVISFAERVESFLQAEDLQIPYEIIDGIRRKDELPTLLKQPWAGLLISGSVHSVLSLIHISEPTRPY